MASDQDQPDLREAASEQHGDTADAAPSTASARPARKSVSRRAATPQGAPTDGAPPPDAGESVAPSAAGVDAAAGAPARKRTPRKKAAAPAPDAQAAVDGQASGDSAAAGSADSGESGVAGAVPTRAPRKRATRKKAAVPPAEPLATVEDASTDDPAAAAVSPLALTELTEEETEALLAEGAALNAAAAAAEAAGAPPGPASTFGVLFQAPDPVVAVPRRRRAAEPDDREASEHDAREDDGRGESAPGPRRRGRATAAAQPDSSPDADADLMSDADAAAGDDTDGPSPADTDQDGDAGGEGGRRRRRRGGKGRRRTGADDDGADGADTTGDQASDQQTGGSDDATDAPGDEDTAPTGRRRTRRRRRGGAADSDDPPGTVTRVREPRRDRDEATGIKGSTRLEAKKLRRREGREAGRRRTIITEAEFLARRESVERVMVVRQDGERTQIGVLEDGVLVEHYVSKADSAQSGSMAGNVYLGRVQNVLPSMEAAFVDIGRGRNAVLYAGEVNWDAAGLEAHRSRRIENALSPGQSVLVQVTKDPIGHKGARLTSQVSLPGRYLVYVPQGKMTGISRKLPDVERTRLKKILKEVVPADAGVIVRTAAEGASEAELRADVERLAKIWEGIQKKAASGNAPALLHGEVDLTVRVIRDVFNEDFATMVVAGAAAWETVNDYIGGVAPDLAPKLTQWTGTGDVFAAHRIDEQLAKAMDRKVWLPSGGSLVIDRTEAMTVIDVNTGKFVGAGGNLEETVTKNNIEAAEEIVRQLRLRDIGGIIVIDFIDMVLESNRDLVVRRLLECLGRDRTKHQVAEVTSLGLVQMTRKRVGAGLIEVFSEPCEHCNGRGIIISTTPVDQPTSAAAEPAGGRRRRGRGSTNGGGSGGGGTGSSGAGWGTGGSAGTAAPEPAKASGPTPAQIAAAAYAALHNDRKVGGEHAETSGDAAQESPEAGAEPSDHSAGAEHLADVPALGGDVDPAGQAAADSSVAEPRPVKSGRVRRGARRGEPTAPPPAPDLSGSDVSGSDVTGPGGAAMGWPQGGEPHRPAGAPTGLGWPTADDVPTGPLAPHASRTEDASPPEGGNEDAQPDSEPEDEVTSTPRTASPGRRRRGRAVAPAGPPRRAEPTG